MSLSVLRTRRAAIGLTIGVLLTARAAPAGAFRDRDCADFTSQKQAQRFFKRKGGPKKDKHNLDADNDGVACEELR